MAYEILYLGNTLYTASNQGFSKCSTGGLGFNRATPFITIPFIKGSLEFKPLIYLYVLVGVYEQKSLKSMEKGAKLRVSVAA